MTGAPKTATFALALLCILAAFIGWTWIALFLGVAFGALAFRRGDAIEAAEPLPEPVVPSSAPWRASVLDEALSALAEGVIALDANGRVLCANAAARSLLSMRVVSAEGAMLTEVVDWPQLESALFEARRTGAEQSFESASPHSERPVFLELSVSAPNQDGICVLVVRDQSRLRQLEALRRDFVANVSHELKTPLAAIQGFVETMIDDPDMPDATRSRFLERMQRQTHRLATLVTDLLTLSRLDEGVADSAEPCDLAMVVREVVRDLHAFAEQRGVALQSQGEHGPVLVAAEREALRQIVSNLTDNAVKYTPLGGSVSTSLSVVDGFAEFAVTDTGIGLAEEDQARVFERFYRVDKARSRELGGTGLGLSIVKNTVQTLGGTVGVRSRLGYGSTFWAKLPVTTLPQDGADE